MILRAIRRDDLGAIYDLNRAADQLKGISRDDWLRLKAWFYYGYLDSETAPALLGETDGRVVAFLGGTHLPFKIGGEIVTAVSVGDLVIHPDYRGPMAFSFSSDCIRHHRGKVVVGMHFSELANAIWKRLGARDVADTDTTFTGLVSVRRALEKRHPRSAFALRIVDRLGLSSAWPLLARLVGKAEVPGSDGAYELDMDFDLEANRDDVERLCERYSVLYDVGVLRDFRYLSWRYVKHPLTSYDAFALGDSGAPIGIGILKVAADGGVQLCDVVYDPSVPDIERHVLSAAVRSARHRAGVVLYSKRVNERFVDGFEPAGFRKGTKPYNSYMVVCDGPELDRVAFTYGDFKSY